MEPGEGLRRGLAAAQPLVPAFLEPGNAQPVRGDPGRHVLRLEVFEGVAHMINLEQPDRFTRLVLDFLASVR